MKQAVRLISLEKLKQEKEYWEGYLKRRREKDAYLKNPSYLHPIYGTPLMEPYKALANSSVKKCD